MKSYAIQDLASVSDIVKAAHATANPLLVRDGDDECLVAMSPAVFERLLFEGEELALGRASAGWPMG